MFVVKVGGGAGIDVDNVLVDLASQREPFVLLHGGSDETNEVATKLGHPPRFVTSVSGYTSRRTDKETLGIFSMIYAGKRNVEIVSRLQQLGVNALGLAGVDGRLLEGTRKETLKVIEEGKRKLIRDDYTGKVEKVNVALLRLLLENGYVPVITAPILSNDGEAVNADVDRCAAAVAVALEAEELLFLSNVPGLLRDLKDPSSVVSSIPKAKIDQYVGFAKDRFQKKIMGAVEALDHGVERVVFSSANIPTPVRAARSGAGTVIS